MDVYINALDHDDVEAFSRLPISSIGGTELVYIASTNRWRILKWIIDNHAIYLKRIISSMNGYYLSFILMVENLQCTALLIKFDQNMFHSFIGRCMSLNIDIIYQMLSLLHDNNLFIPSPTMTSRSNGM